MKYDENVETRYGITLASDQIVRKEASFSRKESFDWMRTLVLHLISAPNPMVVPVFSFEDLSESPKRGEYQYRYAYQMMRLFMLTREEKDFIDVLARKRRGNNLRDTDDPVVLQGKKELPDLFNFMMQVIEQGHYNDIHDGNFLKDDQGNYRIIDLEGFTTYPGLR